MVVRSASRLAVLPASEKAKRDSCSVSQPFKPELQMTLFKGRREVLVRVGERGPSCVFVLLVFQMAAKRPFFCASFTAPEATTARKAELRRVWQLFTEDNFSGSGAPSDQRMKARQGY